ncbi:MAG: [LysW]-lysine hydrolase [Anaerolineae bacterium]|nr:[LysW]-lysine hydrolase [Anaerolineae bacterium]
MSYEMLVELVRHYSPSTYEVPAVQFLVDWMSSHGFRAWIDEAGNACGERGIPDAAHTLMLLGHIDTVPGEIPVRIEDGKLYGRGSVDAKGSLAAFAQAAAEAQIAAGWRVVVIGAVEEEVATSKGAYYARDRFTPDFCIIGEPSSATRITLGYKGRLLIDYILSHPIAHTARPEPTVGALGAGFWHKVEQWAAEKNAGVDRYFDQVMASLRNINTESDHFFDTLRMTMGFRLPPGLTPQGVFDTVSQFAPPGGELCPYSMEYTYQGNRTNALVRGMSAAIRSNGSQPGFVLKTGTSDMNVVGVQWACPIIAYGPGDSNLDHTPDEHLPLDEYDRAVATLRYFITNLSL